MKESPRKKLQSNMKKAVLVAEKNTKRNANGQVVEESFKENNK